MDETATRRKKIDPKLYAVGWEQVPGSVILDEQRAYVIAPGRRNRLVTPHPKKADYVLEYRGKKLAIIEAKSDEKDVSEGVEQAKLYAEMLQIRFTYATNGDKIWAIDMGVKDSKGNYIEPSTEGEVDSFPSPQELWQMTYPEQNEWRDKFNLQAFNRGSGRSPRYYQEIAITNVLTAIAKRQRRILLTMATGTGKTYTAFQICWKLYQTGWNNSGNGLKPRILFISDRNILANQAVNDFDQFESGLIARITPDSLSKMKGKVPKGANLYFTIFQTFMGSPKGSDEPYYKQYQPEFFDLIIIDECHRGGANDESHWRGLMEYFEPAYQLGMTATPRKIENANTYHYFGDPVYTYSLKQGIDDGFLVPYRVEQATSNIDDYRYDVDDDVDGEIDPEKTYTEKDFYHGRIELRERDEHRVIEFLKKINPDEKTLVFCARQSHAMAVRDFINKHKQRPDSNYCERVTADDDKKGEEKLRQFQNNDKLRPTILTTSSKLSTGVDAKNVRNIVLMRPVNNMIEFKQIIGRGTRLFDGKYFFTIYDFVGATNKFKDPDWDGDLVCDKCGNWPCTCNKRPYLPTQGGDGMGTTSENPPEPCPVCGHLPCTCDGGQRNIIRVRLSPYRKLTLRTQWETLIPYDDRMISIEDFIKEVFGALPKFFKGTDDVRERWASPDTRTAMLQLLAEAGFAQEKLEMLKKVLKMEKCDLLDVLLYIMDETTPIERELRAKIVREQYLRELTRQQQEFDEMILDYYVRNGFKELEMGNLSQFINIKYNSIADAKLKLGMQIKEIQAHYIQLQKQLYSPIYVHNEYVQTKYDIHDNQNAKFNINRE